MNSNIVYVRILILVAISVTALVIIDDQQQAHRDSVNQQSDTLCESVLRDTLTPKDNSASEKVIWAHDVLKVRSETKTDFIECFLVSRSYEYNTNAQAPGPLQSYRFIVELPAQELDINSLTVHTLQSGDRIQPPTVQPQ